MNRLCEIEARTETRAIKKQKDWLVILGYPGLVLAALLLSACIPIGEKQFITIALIAGIRWVVIGINDVKVVIIERSGS